MGPEFFTAHPKYIKRTDIEEVKVAKGNQQLTAGTGELLHMIIQMRNLFRAERKR